MKLIKIIAFLTCLSIGYAYGDNPTEEPIDTIVLEAIHINANRLVNFTTGAKIENILPTVKAEYNSGNLSELLAQISPISVKSYGPAGLSNISLRGMGTKHTAILWNGINLQNSMNGGFDMNSMPSFIIDDINIQYGGSGALFGSGSVGGIVHINNAVKFDNKLEIEYNQKIGSFDNYFEGIKFNISNKRFSSSTRVYHKYGKNDFSFTNYQQFGDPEVKQQNSASTQYGILQSNAFKLKDNQTISTNIWVQHHYLEIPPMITNTKSDQNQATDVLRITTMWNRNGEISSWYARAYYNYESLLYKNPSIDLISQLDNQSIIGEIENKIAIGNNFLFNAGLNYTNLLAKTSNYADNKTRNQTAFYSSLKYFNNSFATVISIREEFIDNEFTPFTFSLSSRYNFLKYLTANANISKTFNTPSFNDLYWVPGGNPDLKSEDGWSEDIGLNFDYPISKHLISANASLFNINLNNNIIWIPSSGSEWSAENVEKLWSRGIESNLKYAYQNANWSFVFNLMYSYTKSTYGESENTEENVVGKQLLYIPIHKSNAGFSGSYKNIQLKYIHNFVGKRYITKDNSGYIDPYMIGDLSIGSRFKFKTSSINIQFKVNNIWNEIYEVMAFYAMPTRHYSINLTYNFNKSNN